jgi:hypothetical protein
MTTILTAALRFKEGNAPLKQRPAATSTNLTPSRPKDFHYRKVVLSYTAFSSTAPQKR